jgi:hypothetical protein
LIIGIFTYGTFEYVIFDEKFSQTYDSDIKPTAQQKISTILLAVERQEKNIDKIKTISNWTSNFFYAGDSFTQQDGFSSYAIPTLNPDCHYYKDKDGHWFIRRGKYANDVNIISYYESGRCGEMTKVWNYTANRSGFITREVGDPSGYHAWVEIQNDNEWFYVDPTIPPTNNLVYWYNSTKNRNESLLISKAARVMTGNQDITHNYPPFGTIKINNIGNYDSLFFRWDDGTGKVYIEPFDVHNKTVVEINLSVRNYSILTNSFWIFSPVTNVSISEGHTIEITLYEKLRPLQFNKSEIKIPSSLVDSISNLSNFISPHRTAPC